MCKKSRFSGSAPVLPLEENSDLDFDLEKCRAILAKGSELNVETADGKFLLTGTYTLHILLLLLKGRNSVCFLTS